MQRLLFLFIALSLFLPVPMVTSLLEKSALARSIFDENQQEEDDNDHLQDSQLESLGEALKAAVISGNMTEEEGWAIWHAAEEDAKAEMSGYSEWEQKKQQKYDDKNGRHRIGRLVPPDPAEPAMLLEPEFLPRDVQLLSNWLDLDAQRTAIVEMIVREYGDSFKAVTSGLGPAIRAYEQTEAIREQIQMLNHLENDVLQREIDMDSSAQIIEEKMRAYAEQGVAEWAEKNGRDDIDIPSEADAKAAEWTKDLTEALENIDERMNRLRDRMQTRVQNIESPDEEVTSRDLVEMAEAIKLQRRNLREDVIEMLTLALVIDDPQAQIRLNDALARLRIEHGIRHARMGGEFINPWSLARDADPERLTDSIADQLLAQRRDSLAQLVQARSDAAINREIEGFRLMVQRDDLVAVAGDEDNVPLETWYEVLEPFTASWHAQVDASVIYRDTMLALVDETRQAIAITDQTMADTYFDDAMLRGFGSEMRTRWSERAMQAAISLEELDEETRMVLESLDDEVQSRLRTIRNSAIKKRLERDPELARKPVLSLWSLDDSQGKPWTREDWTGHEMKAHQELNNHVEYSLSALLTPEQYEAVPGRGNRNAKDKNGKNAKNAKNAKGV